MKGPVVALDLGTNTFLMLVASGTHDGPLTVVDDVCRTPRLGAGLARTGSIGDEAQRRGLEVLVEFDARLRAAHLRNVPVRAVGTAALRRANNAAAFLDAARATTGFEIEVLSEADEARMGWTAVSAEIAGQLLGVIDVGGGSAELAADGGGTRRSIPIGAVVLTERFHGARPQSEFTADEWRALLAFVEDQCAALPITAADPWIVLGGTGANLACLELGWPRFQPALTEGVVLDTRAVSAWAERLAALDVEARRQLPIEPERAEILPAGLACLAGVLRRVGAKDFRVSGRGLRFGVVRELLSHL